MTISYPGESNGYRLAREALLKEEIALRNRSERVAQMRRALPLGGAIPRDYAFLDAADQPIKLSELFTKNGDTLAIYSLMYKPGDSAPCPMCVSLLDGLAAQTRHFRQQIDFAIVSAATPLQLASLSDARNWSELQLLSAQGTTYQRDYHGESSDGAQIPMMNIFQKTTDGVFHFWGSELFFADAQGQPRHVDQLWPLWNMLDLTPHGRGSDWYPSLDY